ncbi:hypothetical protein BFP72_13440 [Reichenbachiella sp. 5M10]|uniref:ferredoxin--NADP reductase n=1 Tax=Reichenbachiella sp. 5M10 TaxID=1889772 RepID=UPI000C145DC4|nr:ferredoxin--NADP reductase [Reichenbachiella sp. 5M10]PIB36326.1 hypothetical protein BFP72_13440 [Reichenbachiella sp. 5M10]
MFGLFKKNKDKKSTIDSTNLHLTIKEVIQETKDAVSIVFEEPITGAISYQPGQYLTLISTVNGKKIRRAYSLSSSSAFDDSPTVTIKRVEGGLMSNHVSDHFKAGDIIEVMAPMGSFVLEIKPSNSKHVFLFGGGSGITPLLSITKTLLKVEPDSKVTLLYANRDQESIIFKDKLDELMAHYPKQLEVIHALENAPADWIGHTGYLTKEFIIQTLKNTQDESYQEIRYMTCGPEPMMDIVLDTLSSLSIPSELIHKESFTPAPVQEASPTDDKSDKKVIIHLDGEEHEVMVPPTKSILDAGLDQGLDMPYSCQSGLCTACRAKLVKGDIDRGNADGLTDAEKEEGYVLLCVAHAQSQDIEVEIG